MGVSTISVLEKSKVIFIASHEDQTETFYALLAICAGI